MVGGLLGTGVSLLGSVGDTLLWNMGYRCKVVAVQGKPVHPCYF